MNDELYTITNINRAGNLLSAQVIPLLEEQIRAELAVMADWPKFPPLTRRQRLARVFRDLKGRVADAIAMLRGSYECPYCD